VELGQRTIELIVEVFAGLEVKHSAYVLKKSDCRCFQTLGMEIALGSGIGGDAVVILVHQILRTAETVEIIVKFSSVQVTKVEFYHRRLSQD
jgi:hypothetical protein